MTFATRDIILLCDIDIATCQHELDT